MTTRRPGNQPTPEQIAAGGPPPEIAIISERKISIQPTPGVVQDQVVVTYRIPPNPPQLLYVPLENLPSWVFQRDHPGQPVPPAIQKQSDDALRLLVRQRPSTPAQQARLI